MTVKEKHENEIDFIAYIKIVYKRRFVIFAFALVCMAFAAFTSLREPMMYEASATFFPLNINTGIQSDSLIMRPRLDIADLIIAILQSRNMAERVINETGLKELWKETYMIDAENTLRGATTIELRKNGIIKLCVQAESPELSAKIVNAYVDNLEYINNQLEIGAQRQLVQVVDRATVPEKRLPRGTVKKTLLAGSASFIFMVCLIFLADFMKRNDIWNKIRQK